MLTDEGSMQSSEQLHGGVRLTQMPFGLRLEHCFAQGHTIALALGNVLCLARLHACLMRIASLVAAHAPPRTQLQVWPGSKVLRVCATSLQSDVCSVLAGKDLEDVT